jgi:hypothetical protein
MIWPFVIFALFFVGFVWHTNDRLDKLEGKLEGRCGEKPIHNWK